MLHPVGSQPPSVYWRRRLLVIGAGVLIFVLAVLTVVKLASSNGASVAGPSPSPSVSSSAPAPKPCTQSQLKVSTTLDSTSYKLGDQPLLTLHIDNEGPAACTADLSGKQIQFVVYNGTSRVWGSSDCSTAVEQPVSVLLVGRPVVRSLQWKAQSSQPNCTQAVIQRVGAGSYTVTGSLGGLTAAPVPLTING